MRKADKIEIIIITLAGLIGWFGWAIPSWWIRIPFFLMGFTTCSFLIGLLKEITLKEYLDKIKGDKK